jgi:hypothetical protein
VHIEHGTGWLLVEPWRNGYDLAVGLLAWNWAKQERLIVGLTTVFGDLCFSCLENM